MLVWGAIAASPETAKSYYKMSADEVQLTRSWSIYFFPPLALVASWVLSLEKGVKYAVIGMGVFSCVGATIVLVPSFVGKVAGDVGGSAGKLGPTSGLGHFLVHLGQVVNSLATSMVFCAPCALSATWFPPYQRRRATAVGGLIPLMAGLTLGAVIAPHIANKPENFFWLLLIIFIISVVAMIATFVIPSLPTTPPSLTAARFRMAFASVAAPASSGAAWRRSTSSTSTSSSSSSSSAFSSSNIAAIAQHNLEDSRAGRAAERAVTSLRRSVARYISLFGPLKSQGPRRAAVVTFIAAMALSFGCLYVWQMSLTHVLISSKSAGTLGRANMLSLSHFVGGCAAAIVVSWACDLTFKRKARLIVCGAQLVFAFLTICLLGLCLCSPSAVPEFLISKEFVIFHLVCIGVTVGAATPLLYELCCETLYPIPEALALPLPAFFGSFICIIVAAVSPKISESSFGTVICSLSICETLVSTALICFGSFKLPYFRLDVDEGRCDTMEYQPF